MQTLASMSIALVGSVRTNRVGMPVKEQLSSVIMKKMQRGETLHFQRDDMCLCVWKDKRAMCVLYNNVHPSTKTIVLQRRAKQGGLLCCRRSRPCCDLLQVHARGRRGESAARVVPCRTQEQARVVASGVVVDRYLHRQRVHDLVSRTTGCHSA